MPPPLPHGITQLDGTELISGRQDSGRIFQLHARPGSRFPAQRVEDRGPSDEGGRGHHRAVPGRHEEGPAEDQRPQIRSCHLPGHFHFLEVEPFCVLQWRHEKSPNEKKSKLKNRA